MSNSDSVEVSAASVDEAIQQALAQLNAAEDDVVIEVLATPRSGMLGLGSRSARVRVSKRREQGASSGVTAPPPAPPLRRSSPVSSSVASSQPRQQKTAAVSAPPEEPRRVARPDPEIPPEPTEHHMPAAERPRPDRVDRRVTDDADRDDASMALTPEDASNDDPGENRRSANSEEQVREASSTLLQILELMGERAEVHQVQGDPDAIELEVKGDGSGILIGRHGQTLDALEYILNRIIARRIKDATPVMIDTEAYRARRRQQLNRMALSMAERAKREHEPVRLDPMPPRDRRIVHLALKDDPLVSTRSFGDGFLRSVEIVPSEPRRSDRSSGGARQDARPRGGPVQGRDRDRDSERGRDRDRDRDQSKIGEQGGFKHGQKRLF